MKQDGGLLVKAEQRAAAAWGVDWCRLSVAGATHANQAAVLALGRPRAAGSGAGRRRSWSIAM